MKTKGIYICAALFLSIQFMGLNADVTFKLVNKDNKTIFYSFPEKNPYFMPLPKNKSVTARFYCDPKLPRNAQFKVYLAQRDDKYPTPYAIDNIQTNSIALKIDSNGYLKSDNWFSKFSIKLGTASSSEEWFPEAACLKLGINKQNTPGKALPYKVLGLSGYINYTLADIEENYKKGKQTWINKLRDLTKSETAETDRHVYIQVIHTLDLAYDVLTK